MALFGVTMFPTDYAISPLDVARAVEERGLDSLFFNEHTHIPTSRQTPFPGGGELPKQYWHTHDPFVAFGAVAAVTKRLVAVGFQHLIFTLPPAGADQALPILDNYVNLARKLGSKTA